MIELISTLRNLCFLKILYCNRIVILVFQLSSGTGSALDGKIPVFVFPVQLDFYFEVQGVNKKK